MAEGSEAAEVRWGQGGVVWCWLRLLGELRSAAPAGREGSPSSDHSQPAACAHLPAAPRLRQSRFIHPRTCTCTRTRRLWPKPDPDADVAHHADRHVAHALQTKEG